MVPPVPVELQRIVGLAIGEPNWLETTAEKEDVPPTVTLAEPGLTLIWVGVEMTLTTAVLVTERPGPSATVTVIE